MNRADIEDAWSNVERPSSVGLLAGKTAPGFEPASGILIAVDSGALRHLLIAADSESELPKRPTTKGLEVRLDELKVGGLPGRRYYDVACRDHSATANFTAVAADVLEALQQGPGKVSQKLEAVLDTWRWFWAAPPDALSAEESIGLFGELWFIEFWLRPIDAAVLDAWSGPSGDRHDFKWPAASVETKATRVRTDGAAMHRIASLDQLADPEAGQLYLFSLRATPDPIGAHSLNKSIDRIRASLAAMPELTQRFDERLGLLGYTPAHRQHYETLLRVTAEELYVVSEGFPRLTPDTFTTGLPPGVDNVAYTLDLAACSGWRIADAPGSESQRLRATLG